MTVHMVKRAVVLAGGGSRGAFQLGVWKALRELHLDYQIVTGTSVGALNGAMMVQGDYEEAEKLWSTIQTTDVVVMQEEISVDYDNPKWENEVWGGFIRKAVAKGGLDFTPLEGIIGRVVSEEQVRGSSVDFGLVTVEYPSLKPVEIGKKDIPEGKLTDFMIASAACFPAFRTKEIDQVQYVDGGYRDNLPINLAIDLGADEVIAVDLDSIGIVRKPKVRDVPVTYIRTYWSLGPFLWFDPVLSSRNSRLGYLSAMKAFEKLEGRAYSFSLGERKRNEGKLLQKLQNLTEKLNRKPEGMDYLAAAGRYRIMKALELGKRDAQEFSDVLHLSGELAGKLLGISPTEIYHFHQFNKLLTEKFTQALADTSESLVQWREQKAPLAEWVDLVKKQGTLQLLCLVYGMLKKALDEETLQNFWRMAFLVPKEVMAAGYIFLLELVETPPILPDKADRAEKAEKTEEVEKTEEAKMTKETADSQ